MELKRKIDSFLQEWKKNPNRLPLIIKGARQVGKTYSIRKFAQTYKSFVEINFITFPEYKTIFSSGYSPEAIIKQITLINPDFKFIPNETLVLFDEVQVCPDCTTCLKFFKLDGKYDVICSGSLLGINYSQVTSVSVGFKEDYEMHSLDFEEFLWAKGYSAEQIESIFEHVKDTRAFSETEYRVWLENFREYMTLGGMPAVVRLFVEQKNFSGTLAALPLKGNYNPSDFKIYYKDTGLLVASLDEEAQADLRQNKNFNTYKGAIYENIVADMLVKQGYDLYFYKNEKSTVEMDFFIRDASSLIPIEVKANDNATASLRNLIEKDKYPDIKYGIKLCNKNIGFNGKFYTFPYFCGFLLKRFIFETRI